MRAIHVSALAAALLLLPADAGSAAAGVKFVDEFDLSSSVCGFGKTVRAKTSVDGNPLTVGRVTSSRGFGAHAESAVAFALNGKVDAFDARVGIDADCRKAP